jgi:hypothetical protein
MSAGLVAALLAGVVFVALLLNGHLTLLRPDLQSDFYDLQAHSLLSGRWDVPVRALGLEGFHIDGRNYMYFGPWPAFLRLPVAALTHEYDGRLSQLSMLVAFGVAMLFVVRLVARIRPLVRGTDPVTTGERVAVGAFVFCAGVSVPLFLATRLIVFNEAELWGMALALGAFELILAYVVAPRGWALALAAGLATAAVLSRPTLGGGAVAALGVLLVASWWPATRRLLGLPDEARRLAGWIPVAVAVPIVLYAYVNHAKFGTLFGLPFDRQFVTFVNREHRAVLDANGGSLFGLQFLPTNLLQYLRPDGIDLSRLWPWVRFPGDPTIIGDVRYDRITPTSSAVAAMPLQAVLAIFGLAAAVSPRRARETAIAAVRAPAVGAAIGAVPVLVFGFVAQRYLGDFVPLLVLLGAVGLHVVVSWAARWDGWRRAATWAGIALLALLTVWSGIGLAVLYQRITATDATDLRAFVRSQFAVQRRFPGGAPDLVRVRALPERTPLGTVAVLGDCGGVFVSTGIGWRALERTEATGAYRLRVPFASGPGTSPLLRAGSGRDAMQLSVETRPGGRRVFVYTGPAGGTARSRAVALAPGVHDVDVVIDHRSQEVAVAVAGARVLEASGDPAVRPIAVPYRTRAVGAGVTELPVDAPLCRRITEAG